MSHRRDEKARRRNDSRRGFALESLERRELLTATSETFAGPSLTSLFAEAKRGQNTAPAVINKMVTALESQLASGPLADLTSGAVNRNGFIVEAQGLEQSFERDLVQQKIGSHYPKVAINQLLILQGQNVVASLVADNQESSVGLIAGSSLPSTFQSTINSLTNGPIQAIGTSPTALTSTTVSFRNELNLLSNDLSNGSLTLAQVNTTLQAEAEAYRGKVHAALQLSDPTISGRADVRINGFESSVAAIDQADPTNGSTEVASAIKTFVNSVLDTTGLFGSKGAFSKAPKNVTQHPLATLGQASSVITNVSGNTASDGSATLTATLTSANGSPIAGQTVAFTLDGAFAGVALTNFVGVATLNEVTTADAAGTDASGVLASFAANTNFLSSFSTGNLTVNETLTAISNVSGTGVFGGTDTLTATLTNQATGQGFAGQTVSFSVDGNAVGTATTNSLGVATLSGVTTTTAAGTDSGGIVASFAGLGGFSASSAQGDLVVSQAGTSLSEVAGAAGIGGTANLTATLISSVTNQPVSGQTITFTLDGTSVGTAATNSSGVATLTGVATNQGIGTDTNGVVASFTGSTSYAAAANVTGNLVVSQNSTTLAGVGATATLGGTASLTATLTNTSTGLGLTGQTISFTLDGKSVGTAVTDTSGVATLPGVVTTQGVGTDTNGVTATFAGTTDDASSIASGNLVVSKNGTSLANVSGSVVAGGTATLMATITASGTGVTIPNETLTFNLDGKLVGTAVTNKLGVATLTGVATTQAAGTDSGGVVVTFAGDSNYLSSTATGNLVVASNATTLGSVSGTTSFGGTASLTATLKASTSGQGVIGKVINFSLDNKSVGTGVTNGSGTATLADVVNTDAVGTDTGGITASFAGDTTAGAATATGDLVVSKAATALTSISGTANQGGTATLVATLTSTVTGQGLSGLPVSFKLDGTSAGIAVTDTSGVAKLSNVPTTDAVGTDTGGIAVAYPGDDNYVASQGTGNLIVTGSA